MQHRPCGAFSYGIKVEALNKVCEIKDSNETEMMWVYFKDTGLFTCEQLVGVPEDLKRPEIRMTLDYPDDMRFFRNVFGYFGHKQFTLWDVIQYLKDKPEVVKINQYLMTDFLAESEGKDTDGA